MLPVPRARAPLRGALHGAASKSGAWSLDCSTDATPNFVTKRNPRRLGRLLDVDMNVREVTKAVGFQPGGLSGFSDRIFKLPYPPTCSPEPTHTNRPESPRTNSHSKGNQVTLLTLTVEVEDFVDITQPIDEAEAAFNAPSADPWLKARCRDGNGTLTHLFFSEEVHISPGQRRSARSARSRTHASHRRSTRANFRASGGTAHRERPSEDQQASPWSATETRSARAGGR